MTKSVLLALHYQNENCHPDGKIKVGISDGATWREARMDNARRLFAGLRGVALPIVHARLAVRPDYTDVTTNTPIFKQWAELEAWQEGSWGVEFLQGLEPRANEVVVTHTRNSVFHGSAVLDTLTALGADHLLVAGVSTAYVVESTVRQATDIGFPCTVVADACSTGTEAQHHNALAAMELLAQIMTVDEVLTSLQRS